MIGRVYLLSPANVGGIRAAQLFSPSARFDLARRLQAGEFVPLGEVFSFVSGLYFRGKAVYARRFGAVAGGACAAYVITTNRGLMPLEWPVRLEDLRELGQGVIDPGDSGYLEPLLRTAKLLREGMPPSTEFVLLGSVSTAKYVDPLLRVFAGSLLFPVDFVGRGDMSRGGLLLRAAAEGKALRYVSVEGSARRGKRPARLEPRSWGFRVMDGKAPGEQATKKKKPGRSPVS